MKYLNEEECKNSVPAKEDIGIFLYDIDNDGKEESYCGSVGCSFLILKTLENSITKAIMWNNKNNDSINTLENMVILKSKSLGAHDLLFGGGAVWRWQGDYYMRVKNTN